MSSDPWLLLRPNIILRSFAGAQLHTRNWHMAPGQSGRIAQYKLVCSPCTVGGSGVTSSVVCTPMCTVMYTMMCSPCTGGASGGGGGGGRMAPVSYTHLTLPTTPYV